MTLKGLTNNAFGRTENENNMKVFDSWNSTLFSWNILNTHISIGELIEIKETNKLFDLSIGFYSSTRSSPRSDPFLTEKRPLPHRGTTVFSVRNELLVLNKKYVR